MAELRLYTTESGRMATDSFTLKGLLETVQGQGMAWLDIDQPDEEVKDFLSSVMKFDELAVDDVLVMRTQHPYGLKTTDLSSSPHGMETHRLDTAPWLYSSKMTCSSPCATLKSLL